MWAVAVLVVTKACGRGGFCGRMERASGRGGGRCLWRLRVVAAGVPVAVSGDCSPCREVEASPEMRLPAHFTEARKGSLGQVGNAEDGRGVCLPLPAGKKAKRPRGSLHVLLCGLLVGFSCRGVWNLLRGGAMALSICPAPAPSRSGRPLLPVCRLGLPPPLSLPPRRTAPRGRTCRAGRRGG